jgi:hypothetical protein
VFLTRIFSGFARLHHGFQFFLTAFRNLGDILFNAGTIAAALFGHTAQFDNFIAACLAHAAALLSEAGCRGKSGDCNGDDDFFHR